jgi:hypothetical protein
MRPGRADNIAKIENPFQTTEVLAKRRHAK